MDLRGGRVQHEAGHHSPVCPVVACAHGAAEVSTSASLCSRVLSVTALLAKMVGGNLAVSLAFALLFCDTLKLRDGSGHLHTSPGGE